MDVELEIEERKSLSGSPKTKRRKLEFLEKKYDNTWQSCCLTLDKRATIFFSQFTIALVVTAFCIYQLIHLDNCEAQSLYSSILTLVLGVFLPSPKMRKD